MERPPRPMATMPDWTSSLIPNGSSTLISASSFSRSPVASTVMTSSATSTTRARNRLTVSSTRDLLSASALTLTRISSRCTVAPGSSSTIFSTLMSLFSCLVTCSSGCSSQLTTIVMREISSCSVGPTASESMLKLRRENSPAIRTRTPGLFSTSTDSVWYVTLCLPLACARSFLRTSPVGREAARELDVVVGRAGRDHGPDHGVLVHHEVQDHWPVVDGHGPFDHPVNLAGLLAPDALAAVRLGQLDEVRDPGAARLARLRRHVQVGVGVALVVEQRLPLPDHAEAAVVDDRDLDRDALQGAGGQLLVGHLEAPVAVDGPHRGVRAADLGAHGGGHGEAHRAQTAGVDPGPRVLVVDELGGPHLVLAHPGHVHRLRARDLPDPLDHVLRREATVARLVVAERVGRPPGIELGLPRAQVGLAALLVLGPDGRGQVGDHLPAVAPDRHVGPAV